MKPCPFCTYVIDGRDRPLVHCDDLVLAFRDAYPSSPGHTLIIPRRHVGRLIDLTEEEGRRLWSVTRSVVEWLGDADGLTIGINDGAAAGQTVPHVHLHVITRNEGDVPDPRGGIRWVIPQTAAYWPADSTSAADTDGRQ